MAKVIYTTRTLAEELIGDDSKTATRTLRKFLRDELGEGKAVVGKGGRYSLEYGAPELRAMRKKFAAWEKAQEEAKEARRIALEAAKAPKADETPEEPAATETDNSDEALEDDEALEGPTDEEIAAMLSDADEADIDA